MKPLRSPLAHHFFKKTIRSNTAFRDVSRREVVATTLESSYPIDDTGFSIGKPITTSLLLFVNHSPVKNALWEARFSIFGRPPTLESDLIVKTPSRSRTSVVYKLSSDNALRERYRSPWNEIRIDKLLEDLDVLAATISYKHCSRSDGTARSIKLVTASVEKMILNRTIRTDTDLTIQGAVTWVGCSSMEIQLEVNQPTPAESPSLTANFTFVAKDSKTGKSARINPILPETEKEKLMWQEAEERNKMRKKKRDDQQVLGDGKKSCDTMTCLENTLVCQPQQRNIHGQIFGGFLMRKAFELAYATAYAFAGTTPCFLEINHVHFFKPVNVGDFLHLKSCVLYTQQENPSRPLINVEVVAHVTQPQHLSSEVSNNFCFTFTVPPDSLRNGLRNRKILPGSEE